MSNFNTSRSVSGTPENAPNGPENNGQGGVVNTRYSAVNPSTPQQPYPQQQQDHEPLLSHDRRQLPPLPKPYSFLGQPTDGSSPQVNQASTVSNMNNYPYGAPVSTPGRTQLNANGSNNNQLTPISIAPAPGITAATVNNSTESTADSTPLSDSAVIKGKRAKTPRGKTTRKKHKNSHLGCGTCKQRRIKCDESLPECRNCIRAKLKCAYLALDEASRSALRSAQLAQKVKLEKGAVFTTAYNEATAKFVLDNKNDGSGTNGNGAITNNAAAHSADTAQPDSQHPSSTVAPNFSEDQRIRGTIYSAVTNAKLQSNKNEHVLPSVPASSAPPPPSAGHINNLQQPHFPLPPPPPPIPHGQFLPHLRGPPHLDHHLPSHQQQRHHHPANSRPDPYDMNRNSSNDTFSIPLIAPKPFSEGPRFCSMFPQQALPSQYNMHQSPIVNPYHGFIHNRPSDSTNSIHNFTTPIRYDNQPSHQPPGLQLLPSQPPIRPGPFTAVHHPHAPGNVTVETGKSPGMTVVNRDHDSMKHSKMGIDAVQGGVSDFNAPTGDKDSIKPSNPKVLTQPVVAPKPIPLLHKKSRKNHKKQVPTKPFLLGNSSTIIPIYPNTLIFKINDKEKSSVTQNDRLKFAFDNINLFHSFIVSSAGFLSHTKHSKAFMKIRDESMLHSLRTWKLVTQLVNKKLEKVDDYYDYILSLGSILVCVVPLHGSVVNCEFSIECNLELTLNYLELLEDYSNRVHMRVQDSDFNAPHNVETSEYLIKMHFQIFFEIVKVSLWPRYKWDFLKEVYTVFKNVKESIWAKLTHCPSLLDAKTINEYERLEIFLLSLIEYLENLKSSGVIENNRFKLLYVLVTFWYKIYPLYEDAISANPFRLTVYIFFQLVSKSLNAIFPDVLIHFMVNFEGLYPIVMRDRRIFNLSIFNDMSEKARVRHERKQAESVEKEAAQTNGKRVDENGDDDSSASEGKAGDSEESFNEWEEIEEPQLDLEEQIRMNKDLQGICEYCYKIMSFFDKREQILSKHLSKNSVINHYINEGCIELDNSLSQLTSRNQKSDDTFEKSTSSSVNSTPVQQHSNIVDAGSESSKNGLKNTNDSVASEGIGSEGIASSSELALSSFTLIGASLIKQREKTERHANYKIKEECIVRFSEVATEDLDTHTPEFEYNPTRVDDNNFNLFQLVSNFKKFRVTREFVIKAFLSDVKFDFYQCQLEVALSRVKVI